MVYWRLSTPFSDSLRTVIPGNSVSDKRASEKPSFRHTEFSETRRHRKNPDG